MLLCFVCLVDGRDEPNKAVTYVQGTSVCREHLFRLRDIAAAQQQPPAPAGEFDAEKARRQLQFLKDNEPLIRAFLGNNRS
jgi:hypothetical protein